MLHARLSIVICTYNSAAHLQPQLDSLLSQSRLPDEVVIGDDGSTDATIDILQAFAMRAREMGIAVQLQRRDQNLGFVGNFSATLRQAGGDVVFLCDHDDLWRPDKLALMAARFEADPGLLLLHSDGRLVDAQGGSLDCTLFDALQMTTQERQAIREGRAFDVVLRRSFVTGATAALRRELIDMALPVGQHWIHDEWLTAVAAAAGRIDFIAAPLIDYRQHGSNQIGMRKRTWLMKWEDLLRPRGRLLSAEAQRLLHLERFLMQAPFAAGPARAAQINHKRIHFERRVAIGRLPRWQRLRLIFNEARSGSYRRYGTGARSMLRDLLRRD